MTHVNVVIAGRQYRMACEDGQEEHLQDLARDFDARVGELRAKFGEIGDLRLTVMAALMLADELTELRRRLAGEQASLSEKDERIAAAAAHVEATQAAVAAALDSAAARIEDVTRALNQSLREPVHLG